MFAAPSPVRADVNVVKAMEEMEWNISKLADIPWWGFVANVAHGPLLYIGLADLNHGDNPIPGIDILAAKFDYQLVSAVGRWLYSAFKSNIRKSRNIQAWPIFLRRARMLFILKMASFGFPRLVEEKKNSFDSGERKTLAAIERGLQRKVMLLESLLKESYHIARLRKTEEFRNWNSLHPNLNVLGGEE